MMKNNKIVFINIFILLFVFFLCKATIAQELREETNKEITHLLTNLKLISNIHTLPLSIQIYKVSENGECDGTPETCPKRSIYIVVSTFDEDPDTKVYKLPQGYGWEFEKWKNIPKDEGPEYFAVFLIKKRIISEEKNSRWWDEVKYEIGVNPWASYVKEVNILEYTK